MEDYSVLPIGEAYNDMILRIMEESPINAKGLVLRFDKSPDVFALSRLKYSDNLHLGFFSGESLKGVASLGFYDCLYNGEPEKIFTFHSFYILPEARGNHLSARAMKEFISIARQKARFGIAMTLKGNRAAEYYIRKHEDPDVPRSRIIDDLCIKSILFSFPRKNRTSYSVRNASLNDIPEIIRLLNNEHNMRFLGLRFSDELFQENNKKRGVKISDYYVAEDRSGAVVGVCLAWDSTPFRRTTVLKISPGFYPLLYSYKVLENLTHMAPFPSQGGHFRELTITDYAVTGRKVEIMNALLSEIYYRNLNGKFHLMNFGSCMNDDLLKAVKGFWHFNTVSSIVFTSLDPGRFSIETKLPYIDIAFL